MPQSHSSRTKHDTVQDIRNSHAIPIVREAVLENLFSKHNYLKMRRVSQDKLKPTKLALQLNEEGKKTQKGGLSIKKTPLHSLLEIITSFLCPPSL